MSRTLRRMTMAAACGVALFTARSDDGAAREMERLLDACVAAEAKGGTR